jgi:hypothetical protein
MGRKKLFALASFSAVTGVLVAATASGCSSSTSSTTTTGDAGKDTGPAKPPPPPVTGDDGGGGDAGGGTCPTTDAIDPATLPYMDPAPPTPGKCTEADLTALGAAVANAKSDDDLKKVISAACATCVFTDANKTGWGALPEVSTSSGPQAATVNLGGCYQIVTGNKACGQAVQNHLDCQFQACDGCPSGDQTAFDNCIKKADTGACKTEVKNEQTACGSLDPNLLTAGDDNCVPSGGKYLFEGPIRVQCITGPTDAGGGG